ncbi:LysR family transcriptional regulator [Burkholderia seminalis]|uniref:LysR family transcriptional regulator n=1 Tax=Burkholderia seminalis TaxID=488731 RepID=UPI001CF1020B|nr:LysR family transcriptional regulator [Burkholderia seminalis]MCA8305791.1 LysR family transcriptional regulator [Burkholderia seminalis]
MDLRHLRYFVVVAEELHFTRAAQRIGIAQPPLTSQIKALERDLGVQLFDRQPGRVSLTVPGKVYLEEARAILEQVKKAGLRCQLSAQGKVGRLAIGFTESASYREEVTWALHEYRSLYPHVEISLEEHRTGPLMDALRQERLDLAFVRPPVDEDDAVAFLLMSTEPMVVAVPRGHPLGKRKSVRLAELRDELFVLYARTTRSGLPEKVLSACEAAGFSPKVVQFAPQISSTINLVAGGLGISIVPSCMRKSRADDVRYLALQGGQLTASLGLVHRVNGISPAAQNFVDLVRKKTVR